MMAAFLNGIVFAILLSPILVAVLLLRWSVADARLRGKSPLLVALAVVFFFPLGLVLWLLVRPGPLDPTNPKRPFRLEEFRVQ